MFLKKELIILILISVLMAKLKTAKGRSNEGKHKNQRELNKLNIYGVQTRHYGHYLHKKHKCNLDRSYYRQSHVKKLSRYPTLDKIVHRLDNQLDYSDKIRITTANPFDDWNVTTQASTTFYGKSDFYAYATVGLRKGLENPSQENVQEQDYRSLWIKKEDFNIRLTPGDNKHGVSSENIGFNKAFMQDHTTSNPWENEQHDINSYDEERTKTSSEGLSTLSTFLSSTPTNSVYGRKDLSLGKVPFWSLGQLVPRLTEGEDKKKKTTPMPYVAAHAHYDQILRMGDCHIPKEKVIRVHEVHPDPSKSYSPSCTILHQCGDDTGCCRDLKQVCKPKNTAKVELYFFTTTVGKPQTVEKLHFVNHTECECQKRTEEPLPRDSEFRKNQPKKHVQGTYGEPKRKKSSCICPSRYSARLFSNSSCICDCFDKQDDCLILKRGKAHFSYNDKLCIQSGMCLAPSCEFGSYIRQFGRCPNKNEKYHYSWNRILSYRDLIT